MDVGAVPIQKCMVQEADFSLTFRLNQALIPNRSLASQEPSKGGRHCPELEDAHLRVVASMGFLVLFLSKRGSSSRIA